MNVIISKLIKSCKLIKSFKRPPSIIAQTRARLETIDQSARCFFVLLSSWLYSLSRPGNKTFKHYDAIFKRNKITTDANVTY